MRNADYAGFHQSSLLPIYSNFQEKIYDSVRHRLLHKHKSQIIAFTNETNLTFSTLNQ